MALKNKLNIHHPIESLGTVRATRGDIRVEDLQSRLNPNIPFPHKHDFYQILLIENGRGWHKIDFDEFDVSRNQIFVIKPGQVHAWELSPQTKGFVVEFTTEFFTEGKNWGKDSLNRLRRLPNLIPFIDKNSRNNAFDIAVKMKREFLAKDFGYQVSLQSYLQILLLDMIRQTSARAPLPPDSLSILESFRQCIDENFHQHHDVEFYSRALGLGSKALTMRIHRTLGKSARDLIQERILMEAKRLLVYTRMSIKEIAYELGFEDPNYFVRFFKSHLGATPLKFRQSHIKKESRT